MSNDPSSFTFSKNISTERRKRIRRVAKRLVSRLDGKQSEELKQTIQWLCVLPDEYPDLDPLHILGLVGTWLVGYLVGDEVEKYWRAYEEATKALNDHMDAHEALKAKLKENHAINAESVRDEIGAKVPLFEWNPAPWTPAKSKRGKGQRVIKEPWRNEIPGRCT
jgi:hypothetical protein